MSKPKIVFILDEHRHHSDPDTRRGTVQITYSNGTVKQFGLVSREQYFRWEQDAFKPRYKPLGVLVDWEEEESIPEEQAEASNIRADDHLGQITGIPSHGYAPIREDDLLGQRTGMPTPGFEPDEEE